MLTIQLIFLIVVLIIIIRYGRQIKQKVAEKWRFVRLINQLPGPTILEMLGEVLRFKMNSERMLCYKQYQCLLHIITNLQINKLG